MPIASNSEVPLVSLQLNWIHSCVAISCDKRQLRVVVNGITVVDQDFPDIDTPCQSSLRGNLVLKKVFLDKGTWGQTPGRVTNVNIFSGLMEAEQMVLRTSGESCGEQDGDYLSWKNSSWTLFGGARWTEVAVSDLCRKFSSTQLFSTQRVTQPKDCRLLCQNMHSLGRMASVETSELHERLEKRMWMLSDQINKDGSNPLNVWLPVKRQNNQWLDIYTNNTIDPSGWTEGYPMKEGARDCAMKGGSSSGFLNWYCTETANFGGWYCACYFPGYPYLKLRGLCKHSNVDRMYMPQNSPLGGETAFYGNKKSFAWFLKDKRQWRMKTHSHNTVATSQEIKGRFMLGKQTWSFKGDSQNCFEGKEYRSTLKLSR